MATFTVVSRKVVDVSKKTGRETMRLAKLAKLNVDLKFEYGKQRDLFKEIGEHVHIGKIDDVQSSPKVRVLLERIAVSDAKIKALIGKINDVKRINSCEYCGYVIDSEKKYCPKCSRPQRRYL